MFFGSFAPKGWGWVVVWGKVGWSEIFGWDCWFCQTDNASNRSLLSAVVHVKEEKEKKDLWRLVIGVKEEDLLEWIVVGKCFVGSL